MKFEIKFIKLRRLHGRLHEWYLKRKKMHELSRKIANLDKKAFILAYTPTHGNMGDHAIAVAETNMLKQNNILFVELCDKDIDLLYDFHKLNVLNGHKILLHGGGYLGTLWPKTEVRIRTLVKTCSKSIILFLPNTVYYDEPSELKLSDSVKTMNSNPNLFVCARERISYELVFDKYYNVFLIPDMVLSMDQMHNSFSRSGCLICLRNDIEKTITESLRKDVIDAVNSVFMDDVRYTDMVLRHGVSRENRVFELSRKFEEFLKAELVVTDRLHGMIFAAITGTPCVVLNSKSPKVRGCYEWIKNLEYIKLIEKPGEISAFYNSVKGKEFTYDNSHLNPYYEELVSIIKQMKED